MDYINYIYLHIRGGINMSLRFITGRAGAGKTSFIEREIAEELQRDPMGAPVIVIVPDQMSFLDGA